MTKPLHWRDAITTVAERWRKQYFSVKHGWGSIISGDTEPVYQQLKALGPDATVADVDRIIKSRGWASFWCDECDDYVDIAVQLGDDPDYESATVVLCLPCFAKAAAIVETMADVTPENGSS